MKLSFHNMSRNPIAFETLDQQQGILSTILTQVYKYTKKHLKWNVDYDKVIDEVTCQEFLMICEK